MNADGGVHIGIVGGQGHRALGTGHVDANGYNAGDAMLRRRRDDRVEIRLVRFHVEMAMSVDTFGMIAQQREWWDSTFHEKRAGNLFTGNCIAMRRRLPDRNALVWMSPGIYPAS